MYWGQGRLYVTVPNVLARTSIHTGFSIFKTEIMNNSKAFVYILQCQQYFKIGYTSKSVQSRISTMSTGNPFPIILIAKIEFDYVDAIAAKVEHRLHQKYSGKHKKGEWFSLSVADINEILLEFESAATIVNPIVPHELDVAYDPKKDYWKVRYLNNKDAVHEEKIKSAEAQRHSTNSYERLCKFIGKKDKEIQRLKDKNKQLRKDVTKAGKIAEEHTFNEIIKQLEFIKKSL